MARAESAEDQAKEDEDDDVEIHTHERSNSSKENHKKEIFYACGREIFSTSQ